MRAGLARAATLVGLFTLGGCRASGAPSLQGHWRGVRVEGVAPEAQAVNDALAAGLTLDFEGDTVTVTTPKEQRSGTYSVVKEEESSVVLATASGGRETFTVVDGKTVKWAVGQGKLVVLTRGR